ncbi:MAG: trigger factor, partial [Limisphaerales bacterium]
MNVTVENLAACKKLMRVEVENEKVEQAFEKVTREFQRQAAFPGFRPGKAPRDMVMRKYAKDIEEEVRKQLLSDYYKQAVDQQKLEVLGRPDIEEIQFTRGQPFQFAATLETAPEFGLPEYRGIPLKREAREVSEEDIARALDTLRQAQTSYKTVERTAASGDVVVVSYTGQVEGKPITELAPNAKSLAEQKNFWVEIGANTFLPGFAEQLLGAKAGEHRQAMIDFPPD